MVALDIPGPGFFMSINLPHDFLQSVEVLVLLLLSCAIVVVGLTGMLELMSWPEDISRILEVSTANLGKQLM